MSKKESQEIGRLAKKLSVLLDDLSEKYYDEEEYGPTADIYAKDYNLLMRLDEAMSWWLN